jgi:UDP-N-acetylmuramoylalanine--D-glutamate ligase
MKIAILGFAGQGRSAFEYWNRDSNDITICDLNETIDAPKGAQTKLGSDYLKNLDEFDLIIRTPALHPTEIINANDSQILDKIWSNTNEFFKVCPTKNIIGVTGTKGKGTTSTLIAKMLEACGKKVHLGGNIGIPPLDLLKSDIKADDWVVLELANFQLIDLKASPHIAVCLMVEPEHMDWHSSFDEYINAKQQLFLSQTSEDIAVYFADNENSHQVASVSGGHTIPYFQEPGAIVNDGKIVISNSGICTTSELKLLGKHNWQNACAAVTAVWQVIQEAEPLREVLTTFTGLEHRLEFIRELQGVRYFDDSFGTTPETAIVAIEAFEEPKVLVLGGSDKGSSYEKLAQTVREKNVRKVLLIGKMADNIGEALASAGYNDFVSGGDSMDEIVKNARKFSQSGDVVLLSTACASFDMFKNYQDRGEQFKSAVQELTSE